MITQKPKIVCLCGSTRFYEEFAVANLEETLAGNIVLSIGADTKSDEDLFVHLSKEEKIILKAKLDILHYKKIDLADEILVINPGGYIGESTVREILYAAKSGKAVRFLEICSEDGDYVSEYMKLLGKEIPWTKKI